MHVFAQHVFSVLLWASSLGVTPRFILPSRSPSTKEKIATLRAKTKPKLSVQATRHSTKSGKSNQTRM